MRKKSAAVPRNATSENALKTARSGGARFHAQLHPLPPQYMSFSCQPHSVAAICTSCIIFFRQYKITPFGIQLSAASVDSPPLFRVDEKAPVLAGIAIEQRWKMKITSPIIASKSACLLQIQAHYPGGKATLTCITCQPCN